MIISAQFVEPIFCFITFSSEGTWGCSHGADVCRRCDWYLCRRHCRVRRSSSTARGSRCTQSSSSSSRGGSSWASSSSRATEGCIEGRLNLLDEVHCGGRCCG